MIKKILCIAAFASCAYGQTINTIGKINLPCVPFDSSQAMAIDAAGDIFIACGNEIAVFDYSGVQKQRINVLENVSVPVSGNSGCTSQSQFNGCRNFSGISGPITGIAVSTDAGQLYLYVSAGNAIENGGTGAYILKFFKYNLGSNGFVIPNTPATVTLVASAKGSNVYGLWAHGQNDVGAVIRTNGEFIPIAASGADASNIYATSGGYDPVIPVKNGTPLLAPNPYVPNTTYVYDFSTGSAKASLPNDRLGCAPDIFTDETNVFRFCRSRIGTGVEANSVANLASLGFLSLAGARAVATAIAPNNAYFIAVGTGSGLVNFYNANAAPKSVNLSQLNGIPSVEPFSSPLHNVSYDTSASVASVKASGPVVAVLTVPQYPAVASSCYFECGSNQVVNAQPTLSVFRIQ